jgi:hypothetical protein
LLGARAIRVCLFPVNRRHVRHCHKLFDKTRAVKSENRRISRFCENIAMNSLPTQTQTIHYLVVAFNIRALQVIKQTSSL